MLEKGKNITHYDIRTEDGKEIASRKLSFSDLHLHVRNQVGDSCEEDCSCDSSYMREAMIKVGQAIREKYHWIPITERCFLVMDRYRVPHVEWFRPQPDND